MNSKVFRTIIIFELLLFAGAASAQSTSQDFPTPVTTNEIAGSINARDIGDSRLTTYFYTFNGDQGDLFINIVTRNFTGDLDVFTAATLRPVTKIVVYASDAENETGRAVYFRKPEKLLLRIQGRTPNDDPASFRIKFAGSFLAAKESDIPAPELPKVASGRETGMRVNSVGTLLPPVPKPVAIIAEQPETVDTAKEKADPPVPETTGIIDPPKADVPAKNVELVIIDPVKAEETTAAAPARRTRASRRRRPHPVKTEPPAAVGTEIASAEPVVKAPSKRAAKKVKETVPDPLANIRLVIAFKDGNSLEKSMSEVFKFSVDKGVLTVILKNGSVSRYPITEVAKVTIE